MNNRPANRLGARVRSTPAAYALAIAVLAAAVLLRYLLDPVDGRHAAARHAVRRRGRGGVGRRLPAGHRRRDPRLPRVHLSVHRASRPASASTISATSSACWHISSPVRSSSRSARRRAARKLRASEQRELLRVTLRSIGDAVITTDVDGRVTYMNAVAESLTGWTQPDARGPAARRGIPDRQRGHAPAGRRTRHARRCARASSSGWRTTRC